MAYFFYFQAQIESIKAARAYNIMNQSRSKLRDKSNGQRGSNNPTGSINSDVVKVHIELRNKMADMKKSGSFMK